jgi:hypothetical protein
LVYFITKALVTSHRAHKAKEIEIRRQRHKSCIIRPSCALWFPCRAGGQRNI